MGKKFEPFKPLPDWKFEDYLGWHEQVRGRGTFCGVHAWGRQAAHTHISDQITNSN